MSLYITNSESCIPKKSRQKKAMDASSPKTRFSSMNLNPFLALSKKLALDPAALPVTLIQAENTATSKYTMHVKNISGFV